MTLCNYTDEELRTDRRLTSRTSAGLRMIRFGPSFNRIAASAAVVSLVRNSVSAAQDCGKESC